MSVSAASGWGLPATDPPAERAKSIHTFKIIHCSIFLAQNEPEASESESRSSNANKDQAPSSATVDREESGKNSDAAETKPIKPFKPSEEIAAEQTVDFPVDI